MAQHTPKLNSPAARRAAGKSWEQRLRSPALICVGLALATLAVYWPVAQNDFVNYDDGDYVTANARVQAGLTWQNVVWAFSTGHASNWHPLTWLSHMLDCQLFGQNPAGHHLVSLLFHGANTVLLFLLLRRLTGAHWRSAMVAGLFALHPLHVESVAWVSERKDVLSTLFLLLTIAAYARYAREGQDEGARGSPSRATFYLLALFLFALGLMSKPMLVTVPFLLLLLDWWPLGRLASWPAQRSEVIPAKAGTPNQRTLNWGRLLVEKLPFFALCIASSVVTFVVQRRGGAVSTSLTLAQRVANAVVSYARYIGKTVWPEHLSVLYPHPGDWPASRLLFCAMLVLAICGLVVWLARRRPYLAVGWLWFLGALIPVIGLVQVGIQSMADRYTYVPSIGLFVMLVWGISDLAAQRAWRTAGLAWAAAVSLLVCGLVTLRQVGYWRDSQTLFQHAVEVTPNNYLAYNNLGYYLSGKGEVPEAMENYRRALAINPTYEDALNNMGYALAGQKKYAEAIGYYEAALKSRPDHVEVHNNLGNALSELGRIDEAIAHYHFVLAHNPEHADAHNNFGIALAMQGKLDEAVVHFRAAIRFKPKYASAHSNLGNALAVQHKFEDAVQEYRESLRLNAKDAQAHNNLGNALSEQGKLTEAIEHYREALRLNAINPEAHFNLGLALARQGKVQEAAAHYTEALRLKPDYAEAMKQLEAVTSSARAH